jgi:hypothetical protein
MPDPRIPAPRPSSDALTQRTPSGHAPVDAPSAPALSARVMLLSDYLWERRVVS